MGKPELVLRWSGGELDLMGWNDGPHGEFYVGTLAEGTDWGNPEPVRRALRRFLLDGSRSVKEYDDNRTIPLRLRVSSPDGLALAGGESALDQVDGRRCELVWTPPDDFAPPAVFLVESANLRHNMDDLGENRLERFYTLTLDCLPHAYSDQWVTVEALPQAVSTRTEFEDCADLTGWSASGVEIADGGDYVRVVYPAGIAGGTVTYTGAVDFSTDRYLAITHDPTVGYGGLTRVDVLVGGTWVQARRVSVMAGVEIYDIDVAVSAIRFTFVRPYILTDGLAWAYGFASLGRQATPHTVAANGHVRTIEVPGSRRTPARILAESASDDGLGDVILYSGPDYDPSLSTRLDVGMTTQIAGPTFPGGLPSETRYKVPIPDLPVGKYVVWGRVGTAYGAATSGVLRFEAELHTSSGIARTRHLSDVTFTAPDAADSEVRALFQADLPGWGLTGSTTHEFGLHVSVVSDSDFIASLQWLWLFNVSDGTLVIVKAGDEPKVWIEPTSLDRENPAALTGDGELYDALPRSLGSEIVEWGGALYVKPPMTTLYGWSSEVTDMEVSGTFRPAHHTHPTS